MQPQRPRRAIVVMARYPEPGRAKTRLISALGPEGAAALHAEMTAHTLATAASAAAMTGAHVTVRVSDAHPERMSARFGARATFLAQCEGDLGERLRDALEAEFEGGAEEVLAIAADCPDLDALTLAAAFEALSGLPVVLGPAADGGYYLIGIASAAREIALRELFTDITWSTDLVFGETIERADDAGLAVVRLHILRDVDEPGDLEVWERVKARLSEIKPAS